MKCPLVPIHLSTPEGFFPWDRSWVHGLLPPRDVRQQSFLQKGVETLELTVELTANGDADFKESIFTKI